MIAFQSRLFGSEAPPDDFICPDDKIRTTDLPDDKFVISRSSNGDPLSFYGDDCWDFTPYRRSVLGGSRIYFKSWCEKESKVTKRNIECYKWLVFIIMYMDSSNGRSPAKSVGSLVSYSVMFRSILKEIDPKGIFLFDFFKSEQTIARFVHLFPKKVVKILPALLGSLVSLGEDTTGFPPVSTSFIANLRRYLANFTSDKQTAVIPSRIYSSILLILISKLNVVITNQQALLAFLNRIQVDKCYARSRSTQEKFFRRLGYSKPYQFSKDFSEAIHEQGLVSVFGLFDVKDMHSVSSFIKLIQNMVRHLIHAFSGMRRGEVLALKYACLKEDLFESKRVYYLEGITTKLSGTRKPVRWIVAPEAVPGIKLCQKIGEVIFKTSNYDDISKLMLFTSARDLGCFNHTQCVNSIGAFSSSSELDKLLKVLGQELRITAADLVELRMLDTSRCWENEPRFAIGSIWPLASHQFRRSLAFYVAQSGLVSLPSLKSQLKHITNDMTLFYTKGSGTQLNFFMQGDKDHFISEIKQVKPFADALLYIRSIIESDEKLMGAGGLYIERYNKSQAHDLTLIQRESIIKRFRNGEAAYTETPLGACLSKMPCDKRALRAISACIDCDKAVIKPGKLRKTIAAMEDFVQGIDNESIEYKFEVEQLNDLKRLEKASRKSE